MNRVTKRSWLMGAFILLLLGGMGFFVAEYVFQADTWVVSTGSPHVYKGSNLGNGTVVDRNDVVLLDIDENRTYSDNAQTRAATLHWLGDRSGSIQAKAVGHYAAIMAGYDKVDGLYNFAGTGGVEHLTLSAQIQNAALSALNGRKGTVGIYNYKTGEILCAVTSPTYDPDNVPDLTGESYEGVYLNRFLQSSYVPGSIFKIVTAAAALECIGDIESRSFTCTGRYEYGEDTAVTCETAHGTLDLKGALAHSCNVVFGEIAAELGPKTLMRYAEQVGVTRRYSFDGTTTAVGSFDVSNAAESELAWAGIGQYTDQINPCQYMTYMGAIANGGSAAEPFLVKEVTYGDSVKYKASTSSTGRLLDSTTAGRLADMMHNAVVNVYGEWNFAGLYAGGKSGTAENGGGKAANAVFAGFLQDSDYPLAFIVVVEEGGGGASVCTPILSQVLSACVVAMDAD